MLVQVLSFMAGIVVMGVILFPVLRLLKKRIFELEAKANHSSADSSGFREKLTGLTIRLRESAGALADNGSTVSAGTQAVSMDRIENAISDNVRIITDTVEKTGSVAIIASRMEEDVLKGFAVLEKNVKKMGDIKEKNLGIINGIISLSNKVNKIRDINRIINTITDQTKVIAFNAALEAASAGETGKRFAVVAGEVNRLADDIAVLTRQIREQVEEIQNSSSSLIVYSEEGSDKIAEGYKLIKDLEDIFREIKSSAEITSNQAQTITVSTQQQLKYSEQIHSAVREVSRELKNFIGAIDTAVLSAGILKERTHELERFITEDNFSEQGEHGN